MKEYFERLFKILVFLSAFIYLSIHFTYIFREPLSHTREHLMGFYSEEKNTVDVAVIGTSCTFSAIAPMQMWEDHGFAAYDFCTNVMLENTMRYAIREIRKTQSPRLVVIDVAPFMNGYAVIEGVRSDSDSTQVLRYNTDGFRISKNRADLINEVVTDRMKRLSYYYDLAYYHSNPEPELNNWNFNIPSAYKGYSNLQIDVMFPDKPGSKRVLVKPVPISDEELMILDRLLDEIGKQGLNVLFINGPYWPVEDRREVMGKAEFLKNYLTDKGYDYLDLHEHIDEIGMDGSMDYSMDYNHYSINGAIKISSYLGDYLADNYDLPDRREDDGYDKWRSEYKDWTENILPGNMDWSDRLRREYIDTHKENEDKEL